MVFNGLAIYDSGVFEGVAEDVSDLISMISPKETPLLDRLAQAPREAFNVYHEWLEDELSPNTVVTSNTTLATDAVTITLHDGSGADAAQYLQVGDILQNETTGEYLQVATKSGDIITVSRGFGGTTPLNIATAASLFVVSSAALEGADVTDDTSRPRVRRFNYAQIFKKDLILSGTMQAVQQLGGISNELDYQRMKKTAEAIRDLEKAVIRGKSSGNTLGGSAAYRTMQGVLDYLSTNVATASTLTPSILDDTLRLAWDNGGTDLDLIVADANLKRLIDSFNQTRVDVANRDTRYHNMVSFYESTFGVQEVLLDRWMPPNTLMVVSSQRIHVTPLRGRTFQYQPIAKTGDSQKGMIVGEYTVEVHNQEGMAQLLVS